MPRPFAVVILHTPEKILFSLNLCFCLFVAFATTHFFRLIGRLSGPVKPKKKMEQKHFVFLEGVAKKADCDWPRKMQWLKSTKVQFVNKENCAFLLVDVDQLHFSTGWCQLTALFQPVDPVDIQFYCAFHGAHFGV